MPNPAEQKTITVPVWMLTVMSRALLNEYSRLMAATGTQKRLLQIDRNQGKDAYLKEKGLIESDTTTAIGAVAQTKKIIDQAIDTENTGTSC